MTATVLGRSHWSGSRDMIDGHREYQVTIKVLADKEDGPQVVSNASGLPNVGDGWGWGNDSDPWATCTPYLNLQPRLQEEPGILWLVSYKFDTRWYERCQDNSVENPLLESPKISGSFVNKSKVFHQDKDGNLIKTTSFETVDTEWDNNQPTVRIEQNVSSLGLALFTSMIDNVNNHALWGLGARTVKLSNVSWERKMYGTCNYFYTRVLEFDIDFNTFDREDIPNRGKKVIRGKWEDNTYELVGSPSVSDPSDYIRAVDPHGNPTEYFINKTTGKPSSSDTYLDTVQRYTGANLFLLGIPASL